MSYTIVTVCNRRPFEWYYVFEQFLESIKDEPFIMLTEQLMQSRFNGLGTKPKWLYRAIKEGIIKTDRIIFTDSWDVIFCAKGDEIIERYESFGTPIVVSSEKNCFPGDLREEYDKLNPPTVYKYLNSGFIVGETEAILAALEDMDLPNQPEDHRLPDGTNFHLNDQALWLETYIKQPVPMALDYYQALSQTLHEADINEFDFSEKRIRNIRTNSYPCSFHFNGGSKDNLSIREPILKHLGLL